MSGEPIPIRFRADQIERIEKIQDEMGVNRAEACRRAVDRGLDELEDDDDHPMLNQASIQLASVTIVFSIALGIASVELGPGVLALSVLFFGISAGCYWINAQVRAHNDPVDELAAIVVGLKGGSR